MLFIKKESPFIGEWQSVHSGFPRLQFLVFPVYNALLVDIGVLRYLPGDSYGVRFGFGIHQFVPVVAVRRSSSLHHKRPGVSYFPKVVVKPTLRGKFAEGVIPRKAGNPVIFFPCLNYFPAQVLNILNEFTVERRRRISTNNQIIGLDFRPE